MPYTLNPAANPQQIGEQEYGTAGTIMFTQFTSCMGVIARNGNNVTGVHLVVVGQDGTVFDNAAAQATIQVLGAYTEVVVIGLLDIWAGVPGYPTLINGLNNPVLIEVDDGLYGGRVNAGAFQTYQNGAWFNVP
jgi:hypothetical protein